MIIQEKYAKASDKEEDKKDKTVISDDAFAICEFLERLTITINKKRTF